MVQGVVYSGQAASKKFDSAGRELPGGVARTEAKIDPRTGKPYPFPGDDFIAIHWYNLVGSAEKPECKKTEGSYTKLVFSAEQQARLGIDEEGNDAPEKLATPAAEAPATALGEDFVGESTTLKEAPDLSATKSVEGSKNEAAHDNMIACLFIKMEEEHQMHRLAAAYYGFWHFWFLFLPAALLTMISGVLAFMSTSEAVSTGVRVILAVVVGCLALLATFLQTINDQLAYGSRADMHKSAVLDLKRITDDLEFMQIDRIGSSDNHMTVGTYQKMYSQIQQGCKSMIPIRIAQTFKCIETRLMLNLPSNREVEFKGLIGTNELYLTVWNEAYCIVESYWLFPMFLPDPHRTINSVLDRVHASLVDDVPESSRLQVTQERQSSKLNIGELLLIREKLRHPSRVYPTHNESTPRA